MFSRAVLAAELDGTLSVPHAVSVLTPFSFRIRPAGLVGDEPGYSVVVERSAFRMRSQVILDPLGGRIRAAVLSGVASNPGALDGLRSSVLAAGWNPEIRISDQDLFIGATDASGEPRDADSLVAACISVAAALSEFVLAQLIVTRSLETRPASMRELRSPSETGAVWEYDPSERDRATLQHRLLENWLMERLREAGLEPLDSVRGPLFDLGWYVGDQLVVCEVKSTSGNETQQIRLGLGQVLHYRAQARKSIGRDVLSALLVEAEPEDRIWAELCAELGVVLFWPEDAPLPSALVER